MLVLSRCEGEKIVIDIGNGETIEVVVTGFGTTSGGGKRVRLGIQAPERVKVHREEVARAIERSGLRREVTRLEPMKYEVDD